MMMTGLVPMSFVTFAASAAGCAAVHAVSRWMLGRRADREVAGVAFVTGAMVFAGMVR